MINIEGIPSLTEDTGGGSRSTPAAKKEMPGNIGFRLREHIN
ncbi:hypothetical protein [Desulfopila sp. IMCC35008]|nr:hypothetical protein [Desulfopila sp. IMCC35008]